MHQVRLYTCNVIKSPHRQPSAASDAHGFGDICGIWDGFTSVASSSSQAQLFVGEVLQVVQRCQRQVKPQGSKRVACQRPIPAHSIIVFTQSSR